MFQRVFALILFGAFLFLTPLAFAESPPTPIPTRSPTPLPSVNMVPAWMTPPAPGPAQADMGALVYYYHCMACHGDREQGLTTEWRAQWDAEHQDCARSQCHGARHPPEGFSFPKNFAPALVGSDALANFVDAQELYDFASTRMPYQAPGSLTHDDYWQLTAFILRARGVSVSHIHESNARIIPLQPTHLPVFDFSFIVGAGGLVAVSIVTGVTLWKLKRRVG